MLMNQSNNERFRLTERKIIDAFSQLLSKKELSEITVSEICRMSGIHRTSFYLHFQDVYDLMETIEGQLASFYGNLFMEPSEDYDLGGRFLRLFQFIAEHRYFYQAYWQRAKDLKVLEAALPEGDERIKAAAEKYGIRSDVTLRYRQLFFKAGLAALIGFWLSRGCSEPPETLAEILSSEYMGRQY